LLGIRISSIEHNFVFHSHKVFGVEFKRNSKEWKYREMMCKMWTNFAKFNDPTPDDDKSLPVKWKPIERVDNDLEFDYLKITNDGNFMEKNMNKKYVNFWRKVYENYNGNFLNPYYYAEK
jgi:acetylcholinesterase